MTQIERGVVSGVACAVTCVLIWWGLYFAAPVDPDAYSMLAMLTGPALAPVVGLAAWFGCAPRTA